MKKHIRLLIITLFLSGSLHLRSDAQDLAYSQYAYSPLWLNPAATVADNDLKVYFHWRTQYRQPNPNYYSPSFTFLMPFFNAEKTRRWGGIGLSALSDQTGNFPRVKNQGLNLAYAQNLYLGKGYNLSLGLGLGIYQYGFSTDSYYTESQYNTKTGLNTNAPSGENLENKASTSYADLSSGLNFVKEDTNQRTVFYVSISAFHLNRPNRSLIGNEGSLPIRYIANAGFRVFSNDRIAITPDLLFWQQGKKNVLNAGVRLTWYFQDEGFLKDASLSLISRYLHQNALAGGIEFSKSNFLAMVSYDFANSPAADRISTTGAYEVTVGYRKFLGRKKVYKPQSEYELGDIKKYYRIETTQQIADQLAKEKQVVYVSEDDTTWRRSSNFRFELSKQFNFGFNKTELDPEAKKFADEIYDLMQATRQLRLRVVGYTDNIGSEQVNLEVSKARAEAFISYLESKGIARKRMMAEGKGETEALNANRTKEERAKNRRIVFQLF